MAISHHMSQFNMFWNKRIAYNLEAQHFLCELIKLLVLPNALHQKVILLHCHIGYTSSIESNSRVCLIVMQRIRYLIVMLSHDYQSKDSYLLVD